MAGITAHRNTDIAAMDKTYSPASLHLAAMDGEMGVDAMKHSDSEMLKALKDKAETDPMKAVDELLDLVLNPPSDRRTSPACPEPHEA